MWLCSNDSNDSHRKQLLAYSSPFNKTIIIDTLKFLERLTRFSEGTTPGTNAQMSEQRTEVNKKASDIVLVGDI